MAAAELRRYRKDCMKARTEDTGAKKAAASLQMARDEAEMRIDKGITAVKNSQTLLRSR